MLERLLYFLRRALRNMRQSPFLCLAAVGTVGVSLAILAFFALIVFNVQKLASHWSREVQVVVYLDQVPERQKLHGWIAQVEDLPGVEAVAFVSRREAFAAFRSRLGENADLLDGLDPDFLPASLEISLGPEHRSRKGVEALVARLKESPDFSDLRYGQEWLERFESALALLRLGGTVLGGFLIFATLFIVANTIKLTLYARRDELEIMSLVGGTPRFIKTPFLLEGALQGAMGGAVALGGAYLLYLFFLRQGLSALLLIGGTEGITFLPPAGQGLIVVGGTLLGLVGSLLSLRRFVRI